MSASTLTPARRLMLLLMAAVLAALGLTAVQTFSSGGTGPLALQPAGAAENIGRVRNIAGEPVNVRCVYGSSNSYYLIEKYGSNPKANSTYFCNSLGGDTDQFRAGADLRCVKYTGPGATDGMYKLAPYAWRKVDGLALAEVYPYTSARCGSKPYFNYNG